MPSDLKRRGRYKVESAYSSPWIIRLYSHGESFIHGYSIRSVFLDPNGAAAEFQDDYGRVTLVWQLH